MFFTSAAMTNYSIVKFYVDFLNSQNGNASYSWFPPFANHLIFCHKTTYIQSYVYALIILIIISYSKTTHYVYYKFLLLSHLIKSLIIANLSLVHTYEFILCAWLSRISPHKTHYNHLHNENKKLFTYRNILPSSFNPHK